MTLVFDIGGMSTKVALINSNKKILFRDVIKYPSYTNGDDLLKNIKIKIDENLHKNLSSIAISSCGVINSETGNISGLSAIKDYSKINFKIELKKYNIPIYIENDANCAALAELNFGATSKYKDIVFFVLGTGLGGAIIIDGKLHKGNFLWAGEFGCMLDNINEKGEYINKSITNSTKTVSQYYNNVTKKELSTIEIFEIYETDIEAKKAIDQVIFNISKTIINTSFVIDPEAIAIGGAISQNKLFMKLLKDEVSLLLNKTNIKQNFVITPALFLSDSNIFGAYSLTLAK